MSLRGGPRPHGRRDGEAVALAHHHGKGTTVQLPRPCFRAGDSLLGITDLAQVEHFHMDLHQAARPLNFTGDLEPLVKEALELRHRIEASPVFTVRDVEEKSRLLAQAERAMRMVEVLADLVVGAALSTAGNSKDDHNVRLAGVSQAVRYALDARDEDRDDSLAALADRANAWLNERRPEGAPPRRPLHWPLAFPEVFLEGRSGGFDAMVGNPPFLGGKRISGPNGVDYREHLVGVIASGRKGNADLVAYFFLRAAQVASTFGFLATNTIAQGDPRGRSRLARGQRLVDLPGGEKPAVAGRCDSRNRTGLAPSRWLAGRCHA